VTLSTSTSNVTIDLDHNLDLAPLTLSFPDPLFNISSPGPGQITITLNGAKGNESFASNIAKDLVGYLNIILNQAQVMNQIVYGENNTVVEQLQIVRKNKYICKYLIFKLVMVCFDIFLTVIGYREKESTTSNRG
jgi:hypothetical protein